MKIMVLPHSLWMEMMINCWQQFKGVEVVYFSLSGQEEDEQKRIATARKLHRAVKKEKPDLIVDINAAGILPLYENFETLTVENVDIPWCIWWWDDPNIFFNRDKRENWQERCFQIYNAPNVRHFIWDEVWAREFSEWFGRKWTYLPTATHPGAFHPDAGELSQRKFTPVDACFMGTYYPQEKFHYKGAEKEEFELLLEYREFKPEMNYFEILEESGNRLPLFKTLISKARAYRFHTFYPELRYLLRNVDYKTCLKRRTVPLEAVNSSSLTTQFTGNRWPDNFDINPLPFFQPTELVNRYQSSVLSLNYDDDISFNSISMRSFEVMSCGGILCGKRILNFDSSGDLAGKVYIKYDTEDQLPDLVEKYGFEKKARRTMSEQAREYVLENHNWNIRLHDLLNSLAEGNE